jgi:hypothetical protein
MDKTHREMNKGREKEKERLYEELHKDGARQKTRTIKKESTN